MEQTISRQSPFARISPSNIEQVAPRGTTLRAKFEKSGFLQKLSQTMHKNIGLVVLLIVILQLITLFIAINPLSLMQQLDVVRVINRVSELTAVPPTEIPVIARIGDNKPLQDVETIKKQNDINAQVYKDAKDGDYVFAYSTNKMIIYRRGEDRIIYNGDNPQRVLDLTQQTILANVIAKTKEAGLIANDSQEQPELAVVVDPDNLRKVNANFYANAQQNDIIATFGQSSILVLYRANTNTIIKSGKFSTSITAN